MTVDEAKQNLRLAAGPEPLLLKSIRAAVRRHPGTGLATGFAFGLILGASPKGRRMFGNLLSLFSDHLSAVLPPPRSPSSRKTFSSPRKFR